MAAHTETQTGLPFGAIARYGSMLVTALAVAITLEDFNTIASLTFIGVVSFGIIPLAADCDKDSRTLNARFMLTALRWLTHLAFGSALLALLRLSMMH